MTLGLSIGSYSTITGHLGFVQPPIRLRSFLCQATSYEQSSVDPIPLHRHLLYDESSRTAQLKVQTLYDHQKPVVNRIERFLDELSSTLWRKLHEYNSVIIIEDSITHQKDRTTFRKAVAEQLFQQKQITDIYFLNEAVAAAFSFGRPNAVVIDSGHTRTRVSLVQDGYCLKDQSRLLNFGGNLLNQEITLQLKEMHNFTGLIDRNIKWTDSAAKAAQQQILHNIKVSMHIPPGSMVNEDIHNFTLPDRNVIQISRLKLKEPFVSTARYPRESLPSWYRGLPALISECIERQSPVYRQAIEKALIYCGGNMAFNGLASAVQRRINEQNRYTPLLPPNQDFDCRAWTGAGIVSETQGFEQFWVSQRQWKQEGIAIIDKKCP